MPEENSAPVAAGENSKPPPPRRRVLGLAWPIISENLLETLLGIVDTALVANLGSAAVAGVGTGQQLVFFVLAALAALSVGSSILVAQAVGAKDLDRACHLARQSLLWAVILSLPMALAGFFLAGPVVIACQLEPDVSAIAAGYFQITTATVLVIVARVIGSGVLRGAGDSRTPMVVTAGANVLNGVLAYGLIYGVAGLPALGAVGSAWATFLARAVAMVVLIGFLWKGVRGVRIGGGGSWLPDLRVAGQILRLGVPASLEQILISAAFLVLTVRVGKLDTDLLAAQRISMTAMSFSFLPGIGFSLATTALVGQCTGARRPAEAAAVTRVATLWAVLWMSAIGTLLFLFAEPAMRLFTRSPEVVGLGVNGLHVVALLQPAWAVGMVQAGALRGTGDTRFPLVAGAAGVWTAVLLASLFLTLYGGSLQAMWSAFFFTSPTTALLNWLRFRRRIRGMAGDA
ncbi:MAG: MATE family efflux transporter [Armatimonadetes bacterium]|nr:MATE family efflux transporter [Armatimonadota bacterium]